MTYSHLSILGSKIDLPVGKVVCVGQNYADHIAEMQSKVSAEPLLFMKPNTSLVALSPSFSIPQGLGECHNELELAVLIKSPLSKVDESEVGDAIWGYGIALDLTLRDVQREAKANGRPWERAKSFDGACPMSPFIAKADFANADAVSLKLEVNGQLRQSGNTQQMLRSIACLIANISQTFTLLPGDVVITGTPAGVGPLNVGDKLAISLAEQYQFSTNIR